MKGKRGTRAEENVGARGRRTRECRSKGGKNRRTSKGRYPRTEKRKRVMYGLRESNVKG